MTTIQQSSGQGALFELVARGKKDAYFLSEESTSVFPYDTSYNKTVPFITERRTAVPTADTPFGSTFEVKLDVYGDLVTECNLLIKLPSWLPDSLPLIVGQQNSDSTTVNNYYWIKSSDGDISYGYVNYPAYFLFAKIQFYSDQFLIQEWSGDSLLVTSATEGSWASTFTDQVAAGMTPDSARHTALRATPAVALRLKLPIPGVQTTGSGGFPLCCAADQNFRFRIQMRKLEDLIVSSDKQLKPMPWLVPFFQYTADTIGGGLSSVTFSPKSRTAIENPTILLETVQAYVPGNIRAKMINTHIKIPYKRHYENVHTFGASDYISAQNDSTASVQRRLDGRHPAERVVFFFRSSEALNTNYLNDFTNHKKDTGQFYKSITFVIAGKDREHKWTPQVFQDICAYAKDDRDSGLTIGELRWDLGDVWERERPFPRHPEGTVNFSTADKPTLFITLEDVDINAVSGTKSTEMRVIIDSWSIFEFRHGRGTIMFSN